MDNILIFGGTSEGRELAFFCESKAIPAYVCVVGDYGSRALGNLKHVRVIEGRKDAEAILGLIRELGISRVYDLTHPYAVLASENIRRACKKAEISYIRVKRRIEVDSKIYENPDFTAVPDIESAVEYLKNTEGNILISTGSKELSKYCVLDRKRLYPRVLPSHESLEACISAGIENSHIIALQGPFSTEINVAMLKAYKCSYMVSKQSGSRGGFEEKLKACQMTGTKLIIAVAPEAAEGISEEAARQSIEAMRNAAAEDKISELGNDGSLPDIEVSVKIAGIGMGSENCMSREVIAALLKAEVICGAERMLKQAYEIRKNNNVYQVFEEIASYKTEEIVLFIRDKIKNKLNNIISRREAQSYNYEILVLVSGDSGFYSLSQKLSPDIQDLFSVLSLEFESDFFKLKFVFNILPGISSLSYMAAKCKLSWEDMKILSLHGKTANFADKVKKNYKVFALTSGGSSTSDLIKELVQNNLGEVLVYAGEQLSYQNEKISCKYARELMDYKFSKLVSLIVINPGLADKSNAGNNCGYNKFNENPIFGIADTEFIRGKIPMSKAEIRAVVMSKLGMAPDSAGIDIGAGTGSVSIEMALAAYAGKVYAVEKKAEACQLIKENIKKFNKEKYCIGSIEVIEAEAYALLDNVKADFEELTHAFIGGSSGRLELIVDKLLEINKNMRIVISAISLETVSEIIKLLKKYEQMGYISEVVQVFAARGKKAAGYTMMEAVNPVTIAVLKNNIRSS